MNTLEITDAELAIVDAALGTYREAVEKFATNDPQLASYWEGLVPQIDALREKIG